MIREGTLSWFRIDSGYSEETFTPWSKGFLWSVFSEHVSNIEGGLAIKTVKNNKKHLKNQFYALQEAQWRDDKTTGSELLALVKVPAAAVWSMFSDFFVQSSKEKSKIV